MDRNTQCERENPRQREKERKRQRICLQTAQYKDDLYPITNQDTTKRILM